MHYLPSHLKLKGEYEKRVQSSQLDRTYVVVGGVGSSILIYIHLSVLAFLFL